MKEPGGPETLTLGEYPMPEPGRGELLVRIRGTALNRADTMQRRGMYPPPPGASPILGLEMAGEVADAGPGCEGWSTGDRVFALLPGGGYAEYAVIPVELAMPIPAGMSFEQAAAVPEVFLTAYQALRPLGEVREGEHVLIHAGASGVGTAAIQLCRSFGAHPFVTASGPKLPACRELGAELAVDYRSEDFAARVMEATGGAGVDLIIDFVAAPYLAKNVEALALDGRIVLLSMLGGSRVESFDLQPLFRKRGRLITSTLRNRSPEYKADLVRGFSAEVLPRLADGGIGPVIDRIYDWKDVADAHRRMEANGNIGKIVLRVD